MVKKHASSIMLALMAVLALAASAQAPAATDDDAAWHEYIRLFVRTGFGRPLGESYTLKLDLAFNDLDGNPVGKGTVEAARDLAGKTHWHIVAQGVDLQSNSPEDMEVAMFGRSSFLANQALIMVTRPLPDRGREPAFDWIHADRTVDDITYQCQTLQERSTGRAGDTLCFDTQKRLVDVTGASGLRVRRTNFRRFGDWQVPQDLEISYAGRVALTAHVADLKASKDVNGTAVRGAATAGESARISAEVMSGSILKKKQPKYPFIDKMKQVQGTVILCGVIDKKGKVAKLEVVAQPDESLGKSATDAVKKWEYKPYLLHGSPTNVETTIMVNYALNASSRQ